MSHSEADLSALSSPFAEAVGDSPDKSDEVPLLNALPTQHAYGTLPPTVPTTADDQRSSLLSRRGMQCREIQYGQTPSRPPTRVESDMILDGLADGIKCQSPVGLKVTMQQNIRGETFRVKTVRTFVCGPVIGEGTYGKVRQAIDLRSEHPNLVAVKKVRKQQLRKVRGGEELLAREAELQSKLGGVNTMPLLAHFDDEVKGKVYFVFPYAMGSLQTLIDTCIEGTTVLPTDVAIRLSFQLLNGVAHIHSRRIIHKDLKPPNCMLMPDMTLMVSDFGTAEQMGDDGITKGGSSTPAYQAPEVAQGAVQFCGYSADMWSAGVTIYQTLALDLPFHGNNPWKTYEAIVNNPIAFDRADRGNAVLSDLLKRLLEKDPTQRGVASELLTHACFTAIPIADVPIPPEAATSPSLPMELEMHSSSSSPYSSMNSPGGAPRRQAKLAGVRVDWRSGRRVVAGDEIALKRHVSDPVRSMQEESDEVKRAFCAALWIALEGGLLQRDAVLLAFLKECNFELSSPMSSPGESPLMSPTASMPHANTSFLPHAEETPEDLHLGPGRADEDMLISPHTCGANTPQMFTQTEVYGDSRTMFAKAAEPATPKVAAADKGESSALLQEEGEEDRTENRFVCCHCCVS